MKGFFRIAASMAVLLGLAVSAGAQEKAQKAPDSAAIVAALESAMTPGEGQKKLDFLVGTYDVRIRTWVDPAKPPIESTATSVATWVLGNRYIQQMLAGYVGGQPWSAIGYVGFDNTSKKYVMTYMDSDSTGMEWYTGTMDPAGKQAKMTATVNDEATGKPVPVELRLSVTANGDHVTEVWQGDPAGKMAKVMELQYTRKKS
jgi:hypothetical protein